MKHFYSQIKNCINIALFLGIFLQSYLASSQTTLSVGDVIFTGYDSTPTPSPTTSDSYSFVLLVPISANTVISFTDRGYTGSAWQAAGGTESTVTWTSSTAIAMGTEILISGLTASTYNPSTSSLTANGTVTVTEGTPVNGLSLSNVGDQIIAFQGGSGSITGGGVSIKGGLTYFYCNSTQAGWDDVACANGPSASKIPPGLTGGTSAFYTGTLPSNVVSQSSKFNGTGVPFANAAAIRTAVMNPANWTLSLTTQTMPSGASFTGTPPAITGNPPNRTICVGASTTFSISATNATGYQWQVNTGAGFTNLVNGAPYSGVTTATLTITNATAAMNGYQYRCVATGVGSATSNLATLAVPSTTVTTIAQSNVTCNGGNNGSATVSASGSFPPYTYSWSSSAGTAATAINLTAGTYTVTATDNIGCPTAYTVTITEPTLAASSPAISTQPSSYISCIGTTATFGVAATNTATYQWQVDSGSGYVNITNGGTTPNYSGTNTATLSIGSVTQAMNGYAYRVVLTSSCSNTIASNGLAQLTVNPSPSAVATPSSQSVCSGTSTAIALTSVPTGATFAWTAALTSGTVNGFSAGTGTSISQALTGNGVVTYTVTPTLGGCPGAPITVAVTVNPAPAITGQPSASVICAGANTTFSVVASNATGYQWQVDQGAGFSNVSNIAPYSGATTATLTITGATAGLNGYVYRVVTTGGCTPAAVSNAAALTINSAPSITTQPSSSTICTGANTTFSVSTSNATGYQWQVDQGAGFTNISNGAPYSGATTATLTITGATAVLNGYVYRAIATGSCTPAATSNAATLTVNSAPAITTQPANAVACINSNTTFTVAASNATGYQWQVNQGAGFSNVPNTAPYSGTTTATLTITGVTAILNGNVYRVVATGACTPATVSLGRILTVPNIIAHPTQVNVNCNGNNNGSATVVPTGGTGSYTYLWSNGATSSTISNLAPGNYSVTINDGPNCPVTQAFTITEPPVLVASQDTFTNPSCNGGTNGSATVAVSGGVFPYTYSWSPSGGAGATASGLAEGTYIVTVTDANNCTTTQSFSLVQPSALTVTPSHVDILCNGAATGSASVTASGGTPGYTYSWSPTGGAAATATGLTAGTYTVTVTDSKSCSITETITITEPTALTATQGTTVNINCYGDTTGSATVNVTGGTGTYSYSWAPSGGTGATASGLTAGNYVVTVTDDNACSTTQSFTITQPLLALSATTASTGVSCFGGSNGTASVTASGGTPSYSYSWAPLGGTSSFISGRPAGDYTCTITDSKGCTITRTVTISTPNQLTGTIVKTDVSCNGGTNGSATVTPTGGVGSYTYSWSPTGGNAATASGLAQGTYIVTIKDANLCQTSVSVTIDQPAALTSSITKTDVLCNGGATGTATVVPLGGNGNYTYSWSPSGGTAATATGLAPGNYSCIITDAKGCFVTNSITIYQPSVLSGTTSQINATCSTGGQASVNVSGGTIPYSYQWSSGQTTALITGLAAGNYSCLITDGNGCTLTKNISITTTNTLVATTSRTDVLCNGTNTGSASVIPSGAPGPFTYAWAPSGGNSDTASNLAAGNYSVTITSANGCSIIKNFTITEPTALTVTPSQTNLLCNGAVNGSASVVVTGGTGLYSYSWLPTGGTAATATGLSAGDYTVTIKDANLCVKTQNFTITQPAAITATITTTDVSCNGGSNGSATVNATGGTGNYTYAWSPTGGSAATATGLAAGNYTVTITDENNCSITENVSIAEPTILDATIAQTDVTCIGASDATATVTATGGNGSYTYAWLPSGGSAATATGLSAGNYTVTITDAKGCFVTKPVTIVTTPDVTAPVPDVVNLPAITSTCSVLASQIPVPTATDNCAGIINATTSDPLSYTAVGTYTIKWTYNDGHGNTSFQNQTINVTASPLDQVTFSNASYTFDGNLHALQVANLPAGASVAYSITPAASTSNGAINAGTYTVTAIVSPATSTPNCSPITLTAQLTINKAAQLITFGAIPAKILGVLNDFSLDATSNSGLPIRYSFTYTSALPPANVSAIGLVNLLRSGSLVIVAHQDGNDNYLPAANVEQVLVIKNNDITITKITLGNKVYQNPAKQITYVMGCDENNPNVSFTNETGATFSPAANLTITTPKPGIYTQNVTVTSQDGTATATYALTIEKPFGFYDIVHQKFNNVLLINNNPQTNGGYEFVSYQWFKNGQLVGTGQYYSAGEDLANSLDTSADFSVKMTTKDGKILQTCSTKITVQKSLTARLYPNPIQTGQVITVEADFPAEELENMQISLYTVSGQLVKTLKSSTVRTEVQLPDAESNMYVVVIETANIKKTLKVIVNK